MGDGVIKIIVNGAGGHMGRIMSDKVRAAGSSAVLAASVDMCFESRPEDNIFRKLEEYTGDADVVVDFSSHLGTAGLMDYCTGRGLPVVIATTGQTEEENALIEAASKSVAIFRSANMSLGIAVLGDIVKKAAAGFPDADIEIVETHHHRKVDVPSGTALMLGDRIREVRPEAKFNIGRPDNGKREPDEIGFHSLRYGNIVGIHEVIISTDNETITLKHEAHDRALFADGALKAAAFIADKPAGLYDMQSMLGNKEDAI